MIWFSLRLKGIIKIIISQIEFLHSNIWLYMNHLILRSYLKAAKSFCSDGEDTQALLKKKFYHPLQISFLARQIVYSSRI